MSAAQRGSPLWKRSRRVAVALLIGVMATAIGGWGPAIAGALAGSRGIAVFGEWHLAGAVDGLDGKQTGQLWTNLGGDMVLLRAESGDYGNPSGRVLRGAPPWALRPGTWSDSRDATKPLWSVSTYAYGFPWRCVRGVWTARRATAETGVMGEGSCPDPRTFWPQRANRTGILARLDLPVLIFWRGLLADLVAWTGLAGLAVWGIPAARRAWRRRLGRCAGCGYALLGIPSGSSCPECGQVRSI
jgi:hypothetical protein